MRVRRRWLILGTVAGVVGLLAGTLSVIALANPKTRPVQYSAPFVCGWLPPVPPDLDQHLKPGDYATAINIHNHLDNNVGVSKRVALHYRMGTPAPPVVSFSNTVIRTRAVLEIDCVDIWAMAGLPPGSFVKGAVHIGLDTRLPVAAIYTSQTHDDPNAGPGPAAGHSIDVEIIEPFTGAPVG